jgi:hypothetical protein
MSRIRDLRSSIPAVAFAWAAEFDPSGLGFVMYQ